MLERYSLIHKQIRQIFKGYDVWRKKRNSYLKISLIVPYKYVKFHKGRCFSWNPRIFWSFPDPLAFFPSFPISFSSFLKYLLGSVLECGVLLQVEDTKKKSMSLLEGLRAWPGHIVITTQPIKGRTWGKTPERSLRP